MLTGKYSSKNGLRDNRDVFDGSQQTFPKLLQTAGYQTFIIGKWHLKTMPTGFNDWKILFGQGVYYNPRFLENGDTVSYAGYTTDIITNLAIDKLEKRDKSKPFALLVHHKAPHRNWMPNIKYLGAFDSVKVPIPKTFFDDYKTRVPASKADMRISDLYLSGDLKLLKGSYGKETGTGGDFNYAKHAEKSWERTLENLTPEQRKAYINYLSKISDDFKRMNLKGKELAEWKYQRYMHDYLSCILSVDESVGKILKYLDDNNLAGNTIVVYTSDQGFYLGEHQWYDKRWMYEESFSAPLLIRYPEEIQPNTTTDDFVMNIDYAPTFLDYAGVPIPQDIQGKSFRKILQGRTPSDWRKSVYYHYYEYPHGWHKVRKHYGIRTDRYKIIYFYGVNIWELYDLKTDPQELNNIYETMKDSAIVLKLKTELNSIREKYN
jgi:arylsulfatase A-like enzyme